MKRKPRVILSEDISGSGKSLLQARAELVLAPDTTEATASRLLEDADALILRASTRITREVLSHARRLRIIARTGVGYSNVDVVAAAERGIPVTIVPGANEDAVAEHSVAMMFALSKQVLLMDRAVRQGQWAARFSPGQRELRGRTLGVVGCGRIGALTAGKAAALGMRVLAVDPALQPGDAPRGIVLVDQLGELLARSDFVSLHVPVTPETHHLIDAERLALMKAEAFLINTARGELVDETALVAALREGRLAGAAVDVFRVEPPPTDEALFGLPNVILSPHVAGSTVEANERLARGAAQAVLDVLENRAPKHVINAVALKGRDIAVPES